MIMARVLDRIQEFQDHDEMTKLFGCDKFTIPLCVTWVGDIALAIYSSADKLVSRVATLAGAIIDTMPEFGFRLSHGCSKTASILHFRGKGAVAARQSCETLSHEHLPMQFIPQVHHYKHLGGFIVRQGTVRQDIGAKLAKAQVNLRQSTAAAPSYVPWDCPL